MGKRSAKRQKRQRPNVWDPAKKADVFRLTETKNELLEKYYRAQNLVPPDEYDKMMAAFRRELPVSFRLTGGRESSRLVKSILQERYFSKISGVELEEEVGAGDLKVAPPTEIPWYPDGMAFSMNLPRKVVRKSPMLNNLHNFLITENETGTLSRQETVSMIPPLFMDIRPGHLILDMCAAPGSKTAQIVEILESACESTNPGGCTEGLIVANDSDNKRCYLLVHQALKRNVTPALLVCNHDAGVFPNIPIKQEDGSMENLSYDRILCDVPCSGDGTLRKNLDVWSNWKIQNAHNLHILQTRIAKRGIDLLAVGGRMVYSTCSLNPVENEASLIQILEYAQGAVELVDVSSELPDLKRLPGIYDWKVMDKVGNFVEKYEDVSPPERGPMPPGIFPNLDLAKKYHMERAFRVLPHYQDTGGFFVAVLTKTRPLPWTLKPTADGEVLPEPKSPPKKKARVVNHRRRGRGFREDPFIFPSADELEKVATPLKNYFGITDAFPFDQLLYRCEPETGGKNRNFYFTNKLLTNVLRHNDLDRLHVINAGVRMFHRVDPTVGGFRLAQDGFKILAPFMAKRIFDVPRLDAIEILKCEKFVPIEDLSAEFAAALESTDEGSIGLKCDQDDQKVRFIAFRGKQTIAPYIAKELRLHLLRLLGHDTTAMEEQVVSSRRARTLKKQNDIDSKARTRIGLDAAENGVDNSNARTGLDEAENGESAKEENGQGVGIANEDGKAGGEQFGDSEVDVAE